MKSIIFRKQNFSRQLLKGSASIYDSSGSHFFKTNAGIQSGLDAFKKLRLAMTVLPTWELRENYAIPDWT